METTAFTVINSIYFLPSGSASKCINRLYEMREEEKNPQPDELSVLPEIKF